MKLCGELARSNICSRTTVVQDYTLLYTIYINRVPYFHSSLKQLFSHLMQILQLVSTTMVAIHHIDIQNQACSNSQILYVHSLFYFNRIICLTKALLIIRVENEKIINLDFQL